MEQGPLYHHSDSVVCTQVLWERAVLTCPHHGLATHFYGNGQCWRVHTMDWLPTSMGTGSVDVCPHHGLATHFYGNGQCWRVSTPWTGCPLLWERAVLTCVHTVDWLPVLGMFNVRTDVDACHCTRGLLATDTVTESALKMDWDKNRLPHRGIKPASVLRLASQSNALPTFYLYFSFYMFWPAT